MAGLSGRYAAALFDLALESNAPQSYREGSALILQALDDDDCRRILQHPNISSDDKQKFVTSVFAGRVNDDLLGFLRLAVAKNRERVLADALSVLCEKLDALAGKAKATIVSAHKLEHDQIHTLQQLISRKLGQQVEVSVEVDQTLIGGFYIHAQGHLIDCSVKRQLSQIKTSLQGRCADDFAP